MAGVLSSLPLCHLPILCQPWKGGTLGGGVGESVRLPSSYFSLPLLLPNSPRHTCGRQHRLLLALHGGEQERLPEMTPEARNWCAPSFGGLNLQGTLELLQEISIQMSCAPRTHHRCCQYQIAIPVHPHGRHYRSSLDGPSEQVSSPVRPDTWVPTTVVLTADGRHRCLSRSFPLNRTTLLDTGLLLHAAACSSLEVLMLLSSQEEGTPSCQSFAQNINSPEGLFFFSSSSLLFINIHPSAARHLNHHQRPTTITFIGRHSFLAFLDRV